MSLPEPTPTSQPVRPAAAERRAHATPATDHARTAPATCPLCTTPLYGLHCKQVCPNCGYREDCSDLFPL